MLIPNFYLINATNIEYLLWARHCLSTQDESMKKVDVKKEKKDGYGDVQRGAVGADIHLI